jgi:hypothetical protein
MKYFIVSIDTNGININKDNIIAMCLQKIDFSNNIIPIEDDLTILLKSYSVKDTTKYHGFTNDDLIEFGISDEDAQLNIFEYLFNVDENIDMTNICFIGVNLDKFLLPFLTKFFQDNLLDSVKILDISSAVKIILNADSFSEALDILQITSKNDNCFNKMNNILKVMQIMRGLVNE